MKEIRNILGYNKKEIDKKAFGKGGSKDMAYSFYGWEQANVPAVAKDYPKIETPLDLYDVLSEVWCKDTCAPRMQKDWSKDNKTLGQCSITAFLAQDIFGGKVYGIPRGGGNYHCYNVVGDCVFDLTSEQFGDEVLSYADQPQQLREVHFAKEEKRKRYEYLRQELKRYLENETQTGYCSWGRVNERMQIYHDTEWGVPVHDDRTMFEHLMLEAMQCGLSWDLMLKKREIFRKCFDGFDFDKIASYGEDDVQRILDTEGMIRSVRKIRAVIGNARCCQEIIKAYGSLSDYFWAFSDHKTILYKGHGEGAVPVSNGLSDRIGKDLKKRGFRYVGPVTVYSHLQACGIINDHDKTCPCYRKIIKHYPTVEKQQDLEVM